MEINAPLWRDQACYDAFGRGGDARDGGGVMRRQAIYGRDLALSLAGPVTQVQAMTATRPLHRMDVEDMAVAGLGAVGTRAVSTARCGSPAGGPMCIGATGGARRCRAGPRTVREHRVIAAFEAAVGQGRTPLATGPDGLAWQRPIAGLERGLARGRPVAMSEERR
ncbi:hypothetical protein ACN2XU_03540 [Primorskyibacter sp. 2E107]|uniref:Gfo/Idh/MocA family protein n=1 Tax=Primorskyibacter sp. 2E107 TaxID=3403458 RepID=UPI003AF591F8